MQNSLELIIMRNVYIYIQIICVNIYINEQVRLYPTSVNFLQSYTIEAGSLFNSVIVKDEIPSSDITMVQYLILL